jgi:hypothetical protein
MAKAARLALRPEHDEPRRFISPSANRHSGARVLRKIDEVNFVAERANPESRNGAWRWIPGLRPRGRIPE